MGQKIRITGAWIVRNSRTILARSTDDIIYRHVASRWNADHYPGLVQKITAAREIDLDHWEVEADDREASAYFANMQGFD